MNDTIADQTTVVPLPARTDPVSRPDTGVNAAVSGTREKVSARREVLVYPNIAGDSGYIGMFVDDVQVAAAIWQEGTRFHLWSSGLTLRQRYGLGPNLPTAAVPLDVASEQDARAWLDLIADLAEHGPHVIEQRRGVPSSASNATTFARHYRAASELLLNALASHNPAPMLRDAQTRAALAYDAAYDVDDLGVEAELARDLTASIGRTARSLGVKL